jgi:prepilin-type N-terminal cleavage/methylation domain-containing protein
MKRRRRGFTLIELLVVIAIIAIMAIVYPLPQNNWEMDPSPDPNRLVLQGVAGCDQPVPPGPNAKEFQTPDCLAYQ